MIKRYKQLNEKKSTYIKKDKKHVPLIYYEISSEYL